MWRNKQKVQCKQRAEEKMENVNAKPKMWIISTLRGYKHFWSIACFYFNAVPVFIHTFKYVGETSHSYLIKWDLTPKRCVLIHCCNGLLWLQGFAPIHPQGQASTLDNKDRITHPPNSSQMCWTGLRSGICVPCRVALLSQNCCHKVGCTLKL